MFLRHNQYQQLILSNDDEFVRPDVKVETVDATMFLANGLTLTFILSRPHN